MELFSFFQNFIDMFYVLGTKRKGRWPLGAGHCVQAEPLKLLMNNLRKEMIRGPKKQLKCREGSAHRLDKGI